MHIPTEAETSPEDLSVKQTMSILRHLFENVLNIPDKVFAEEDGVIHIGTEFKLWNDTEGWHCSQQVDDYGRWGTTPVSPDPMSYFTRIIGRLALKTSLDRYHDWVLTAYCCMA